MANNGPVPISTLLDELPTEGIRCGPVSGEFLREASGLRHQVFCDELGWLPTNASASEADFLDPICDHLAVWSDSVLVGYIRLARGPGPYLTERCFRHHLEGGTSIRSTPDTAEISRLCVRKEFRRVRASSPLGLFPLSQWLFRETYRWCMAKNVRYTFFVTTEAVARLLRHRGFPIRRMNLWNAGETTQVLSELDWREFEALGAKPLLDWFTGGAECPAAAPCRSPGRGW